jgi:WD40 repeat protein
MGQGLLVTGSRDRSIALWDTQEMTANNDGTNSTGLIQKWTDVHKGWVWSLSKDANCATTLVSCGWDSKANIWRLTNSEMVLQASINCSTALLCSDIHSASGLVVVGTFDKRVKMFDLRSSTPTVAEFKHHKMPVLSVCALPNDSYGVISASEDGTLAKMDTRTKKVVSRLYFKNGGGFPMCMGLMEGCTCLVVGDKIGGLHLVDTNKMQEIKVLPNLHDGKITGIDVSIGGIVTCSTDGKVKILQPDISLATIATIEDKDFGDVTAVSMNNDILATGSSLEMVQIWRPKTDDNSNAVVMAT